MTFFAYSRKSSPEKDFQGTLKVKQLTEGAPTRVNHIKIQTVKTVSTHSGNNGREDTIIVL